MSSFMKKGLSTILATMMIVTLFVNPAFAAITWGVSETSNDLTITYTNESSYSFTSGDTVTLDVSSLSSMDSTTADSISFDIKDYTQQTSKSFNLELNENYVDQLNMHGADQVKAELLKNGAVVDKNTLNYSQPGVDITIFNSDRDQVEVSVEDANGNVVGGPITVESTDYYETSDETRLFIPVPIGTYTVVATRGTETKQVTTDVVENTSLDLDTTSPTVSIAENGQASFTFGNTPNVQGTLSEAGKTWTLGEGSVSLYNVDSYENYNLTIDSNGQFTGYLPAGTYDIATIYLNSGQAVSVNQTLEITDSTILTEIPTIDIPAVTLEATIEGHTFSSGDDIWIEMINQEDGHHISVPANTDGTFQARLSAGTYSVTSIRVYSQDGTREFLQVASNEFTITDGNVTSHSVSVQQPNVNGAIVTKELASDGTTTEVAVANAWLNIVPAEYTEEHKSYEATTDANGNFSVYLPTGEYRIHGYSEQVSDTEWRWVQMDYTFTVGTENNDIKIVVPQAVTGTIEYEDGAPVEQGYIQLRNETTEQNLGGEIKNGSFTVRLTDGQYRVEGFRDNSDQSYTALNQSFTIKEGVVTSGSLDISVPEKNVNGTVYNGSALVSEAWLNIVSTGVDRKWYNTKITNGEFSLHLPDGSYDIEGYWDQNNDEFVQISESFTVLDGHPSPNPLEIKVPEKNVSGTLTNENGTLVSNVWLNFRNMGSTESRGYQTKVKDDGSFNLYLPDGQYEVEGYWDESTQQFVQVPFEFTVSGDNYKTNPLEIVIPEKNVTGTITSSTGTLVEKAWINIRSIGSLEHKGYHTQVKNGDFSMHLPEGDYEVEGYWNENTEEYVRVGQEFTVISGQTKALDIVVPETNVTGVIEKTASGPVELGWLQIRKTGSHEGFNARIKAGNFELYLPDGEYEVQGYWDEINQKHQSVPHTSFTVENGTLSSGNLYIEVPDENVSGKVTVDGQPVERAWLNIHSADNVHKGYNAQIQNGSFELYLPDGEYEVDGYWDEIEQDYVRVSHSFEVDGAQTVTIKVHGKNVSGTIDTANREANGWLEIENTNIENKHYQARIRENSFSLYLPDGEYKAVGYWDEVTQNYIQLNTTFTVEKGQVSPSQLNISVPTPNVTGTVKAVNKGWLQIKDKEEDEGYSTRIKNGSFSLYLPDGEYEIEGYWDEEAQEYVRDRTEFTVSNGQPSLNSIDIAVHEKNVTGQVKNGSAIVQDAWLNIRNTENDEDEDEYNVHIKKGNFSLYLPDGKYEAVGYWDEKAQEHVQIGETFTVNGGISSLVLEVPEKNVQGVLNVDSEVVENAWLNIRRLDNGNQKGGKVFNTKVKKGNFSLNLPDGNYKVEGYWNENTEEYVPVSHTFFVQNGTPSEETITINVQPIKVSGQVTYNGEPLSKVWVLFKDDNDENIFVSTNGNGKYKLRASEGTYKLVGVYLGKKAGWHLENQTVTIGNTSQVIDIEVEGSESNE